MDVLKINDMKIKIMLTASEAQRFGIDEKAVAASDEDTRARIFTVLDEVERLYGFHYGTNKLLIQLYPGKDGSAEIFVTRLSALSTKNERAITGTEQVTVLDSKKMLFRFSDFEDLLGAVRCIANKRSIQQSELYYSPDEGYYLELAARGGLRLGAISELAVLLEYGARVPIELIPYIEEHTERLTEGNALSQLSRLR